MTISKERFEQLALEVAKDISGFLWYEGCHYETGVSDTDLYEFAHALIQRVEAESEVIESETHVGYTSEGANTYSYKSCTALPLVGE